MNRLQKSSTFACRILLAAALAVSPGFVSPGGAAEPERVPPARVGAVSAATVEQRAEGSDTIYAISAPGCRIEWIARNVEIGVVKHWSECNLSLSGQIPLWERLCAAFMDRDPNARAFRLLFWGRIEPEPPDSGTDELSLRLALAVHQSPGWDRRRGKPLRGDLHRFIRDAANQKMIYPELKELFARFQRTVALAYVEKVRIGEAGRLPFFGELKRHGVKATDRLPFDAVAWFGVASP